MGGGGVDGVGAHLGVTGGGARGVRDGGPMGRGGDGPARSSSVAKAVGWVYRATLLPPLTRANQTRCMSIMAVAFTVATAAAAAALLGITMRTETRTLAPDRFSSIASASGNTAKSAVLKPA